MSQLSFAGFDPFEQGSSALDQPIEKFSRCWCGLG